MADHLPLREILEQVLAGNLALRIVPDPGTESVEAQLLNTLLDRYADAGCRRDLYLRALTDMVRRFEESIDFLSVVRRLTEIMNQTDRSVCEVCQEIVRALVEETHVANSSILLAHPREPVLRLAAAWGADDSGRTLCAERTAGYNTFLQFQRGEGIAGRVAATLEPYLCEDVEHDPVFLRLQARVPIRSLFALPLAHNRRFLGVLNLSDHSCTPFAPHQRQGFVLLAGVISQLLVLCQQQSKLRESEAYYRDLVEHGADVILATDMGLCLVSLNQAGRRLFGIRSDQVRGTHLLKYIAPEYVDRFCRAVHDLIYERIPEQIPVGFLDSTNRTTRLECAFRLIVEDGWPLGIEVIGRARERVEVYCTEEALAL